MRVCARTGRTVDDSPSEQSSSWLYISAADRSLVIGYGLMILFTIVIKNPTDSSAARALHECIGEMDLVIGRTRADGARVPPSMLAVRRGLGRVNSSALANRGFPDRATATIHARPQTDGQRPRHQSKSRGAAEKHTPLHRTGTSGHNPSRVRRLNKVSRSDCRESATPPAGPRRGPAK